MPRSARSPLTTARRALLGAAAAAAVALPATAQASTACSYSATTATVTINMSASGDTAKVGRTAAGAITSNGAACGAATVTNTNTIKLTGGDGAQTAEVDLANGPLGPGKTAEAGGTSEIEIVVTLGASFDDLRLLGSSSAATGDALRVGTLGATLNADTDVDLTYSGADAFELLGFAGNDTLSLGGSAPTGDPIARDGEVYGGAGADTITGGRDGDYLFGDTDSYFGPALGASIDTINGGDGNDTIAAQAGDDKLAGEEDGDTIYLDLGKDTIDGGEGGDYFQSQSGAGAAPDGADAIRGGEGEDRLDLSARTGNLVITLDNLANDGADTSAPADGVADEGDNFGADIENVTTGAGNDRVSADTAAANAALANNDLDGNAGNDILKAGAGSDYLAGDAGNDELTGGDGGDSLYGSTENDKLLGGAGTDDLTAGAGVDQTSGEAGNDRIYEESAAEGADAISGGAGRDFVSFSQRTTNTRLTLDDVANDGADANQDGTAEEKDNVKSDVEDLRTGSGNDLLSADTAPANAKGAGNRFDAGSNNDVMLGGAGEDELYGEDGADQITGGPGEDSLSGDRGADRFTALDGFWDDIDGGFDSDTDVITNADASDSRVRIP